MRRMLLIACGVLALAGCVKKEEAAAAADVGGKVTPSGRARFVAVGLYMPDGLWTQIARAPDAAAPEAGAPVPEDDSQVIVVLDSATGEVRQCGNLSGRCIALNPWTRAAAPTVLVKHAADLAAEAEAEAKAAERR